VVLEAVGLRKRFRTGRTEVWAVDGISIRVPAGQIVVVHGPSGSGKTTLLALLGGLLTPTEGHVSLGGQDLHALSGEARVRLRLERIGFIFQRGNLLEALSPLENVALPARLVGADPEQASARAAALLQEVSLARRADQSTRALSAGESQRAAIARALVNRPALVLADEPTASLDSENRRRVMDILQRLAREASCALVVATHDSRLHSIADRIFRIEDGRPVDS
jgi:ABC-type lipoprotein export system ATPase subunit